MIRSILIRMLLAAGLVFAGSTMAHAQCSNANINTAFQTVLHRAPRGSGTSGECNPTNYGGGSWTNQADLQNRVGAASYCPQPWIGQIYYYTYSRFPTNAECTAYYGTYSSYMDLASKIQAYQKSHSAIATNTAGTPSYVSSTSNNPAAGSTVLRGNNIVAGGGGNIVAGGGGNIVAGGGGNIVAGGGGNAVAGGTYQTMSVGSGPKAPAGKYLVAPNLSLVDQNGTIVHGARTYKLMVRSGSYVVSSTGTIVPQAGMIVLLN